jgi:hypothetical protein
VAVFLFPRSPRMIKAWKRQIMAFITGKLDRFMRFWRADGWPKKKKPQIMVFITGNQGSIEIERDRDPAMTHVDPLAFPTLDPDRSILTPPPYNIPIVSNLHIWVCLVDRMYLCQAG